MKQHNQTRKPRHTALQVHDSTEAAKARLLAWAEVTDARYRLAGSLVMSGATLALMLASRRAQATAKGPSQPKTASRLFSCLTYGLACARETYSQVQHLRNMQKSA